MALVEPGGCGVFPVHTQCDGAGAVHADRLRNRCFQRSAADSDAAISLVQHEAHQPIEGCAAQLLRVGIPWDSLAQEQHAHARFFGVDQSGVPRQVMRDGVAGQLHQFIRAVHKGFAHVRAVDGLC